MKASVMFGVAGALLVSASVITAEEPAKKQAKDEVTKLTGTWTATQVAYQGQIASIDYKLEVMITGNNYTVLYDGKVGSFGSFQPVVAGDKKGMDLSITQPVPSTYLMLYDLKGDTLRISFDLQGGKRPTGFDTPPGSNVVSAVYKRSPKK